MYLVKYKNISNIYNEWKEESFIFDNNLKDLITKFDSKLYKNKNTYFYRAKNKNSNN